MQTIHSAQEMQTLALKIRGQNQRLALVPTMGALHEGHLSLVRAARQQADWVCLSVFVNPTQFGPNEDLSRYPRDFERDAGLAEKSGVDFLFAPSESEIYPDQDQSWVLVTELTRGLCGPFRPGHFRGVTTVVMKLLMLALPTTLWMGEKDYQQLMVIRRMVRDLHVPVKVEAAPTLRDPDGLAMSSRNAYLSPEERGEALRIFEALRQAESLLRQGSIESATILDSVKRTLRQAPHLAIEYAEIVDAESLEITKIVNRPSRLMIAVHINGKRLIDNIPLKP